MFCPSCGIEYTVELNYCNRCGANLATTPAGPTMQPVPVGVAKPAIAVGITLAVLTLGGFAILIAGALALTGAHAAGDALIAMMFLGMTAIGVTDILLVRLLSRLITASLSSGQLQAPKRSTPPALNSASISQLPGSMNARFEPVASVTEHTTRFLESQYLEPAELSRRQTAENLKD